MKAILKWVLKIGLIILAFYLVFRKVSLDDVKQTWQHLNPFWLLPAFLLYNLSQFISAYRLLQLFRCANVDIRYLQNLRLYYKAMFFGLFLPGGVSGDAYKVIYLQKRSDAGYKTLITATLLDRVNGLMMLLTIAAALLTQRLEVVAQMINYAPSPFLLLLIVLIAWITYYFVHRKLFPTFTGPLGKISALSLSIQACQLLAFFCILYAFSIAPGQWLSYGILFYTGSVLSALPLSISGLGIREWVLVTGSGIMMLDSATAFSASLIFTLISGICALIGAGLRD